jgi:hypothetical protein
MHSMTKTTDIWGKLPTITANILIAEGYVGADDVREDLKNGKLDRIPGIGRKGLRTLKALLLPIETLSKHSRCPNCARRFPFHAHQDGWQCIYCRAICKKDAHKLIVSRIDEIILAPGELEALRNAR